MQSDVHFIPLAKENWNPVANVDTFLTNVYVFHRRGGTRTLVVQYICDIFGLVCISVLILICFQFINWHDIMYQCINVTTCVNIRLFTNTFKIGKFGVFYIMIMTMYIAYRIVYAVNHCIDIIDIRNRLRDEIEITESQFLKKSWNEVMELLVEYNRHKHFCIMNPNLSTIDIINVMMRQTNFIVALVSNGIVPQWCINDIFLTVFERFVLRPMFTEQNRLISILDIKKNQKSLYIMGVCGLCILPITVIFVTMTYIVQHVNDIKSRSVDFLVRQHLTPGAKYYFGLFNELPHTLETRIEKVEPLIWQCLDCQRTPIRGGMFQCLLFVFGSAMALLIAISIVNEEALLHLRLGGYPLVWWMAVLSALFAVCRYATHLSPDFSHYDALNEILCTHIKFDSPVHLKRFCRPQFLLILFEIYGCVITPLLLICVLPAKLNEIFHFLQRITITSPHGDVVWYQTEPHLPIPVVSIHLSNKLHSSSLLLQQMSDSSNVLFRESISSSLIEACELHT